MPSRSSKPKRTGTAHDFTTIARRVVEQAIGEKLDGSPLDDPHEGKNPAAVALGKLGGAKEPSNNKLNTLADEMRGPGHESVVPLAVECIALDGQAGEFFI